MGIPDTSKMDPPAGAGAVAPAVVEMIDVSKSFGATPILQGVNLTIRGREILTLVGRSGAGKSVTLKHLVGLVAPDAGTVRVMGVDVNRANPGDVDEVRKQVGYLFQGAALLNSVNAFENVALPLREHESLTEGEIRERVGGLLGIVGLAGFESKMPSQMSGGQRKRVGLARALVRNARLVLYDEPTAGLDPPAAASICELIVKMKRELGVTSIVVTHEMEYAFRVADRIAMLHEGRIRIDGAPDVVRRAEDLVVRHFIEGRPD